MKEGTAQWSQTFTRCTIACYSITEVCSSTVTISALALQAKNDSAQHTQCDWQGTEHRPLNEVWSRDVILCILRLQTKRKVTLNF
jgi:hypothetical protein